MKRGFIVCLQLLVVIALLQTTFVQYWVGDARILLSDAYDYAANYGERRALDAIQASLQPHIATLTPEQRDYLQKVTSDPESMRRFSVNYCIGTDVNPYVYGEMLQLVCRHLNQSDVVFPTS